MEEVLKRGKIFVANTHPIAKAVALPGVMRFHEMENDNVAPTLTGRGKPPTFRHDLMSQLSSAPLMLGVRPARYSDSPAERARAMHRAVIVGLRHGLVYYLYGKFVDLKSGGYGIINRMFPITPVELGEGFLIGKERILTAVSRSFVTEGKPKSVHCFDAYGRERPGKVETVQTPQGWRTTVTLQDWQESAAIVLE